MAGMRPPATNADQLVSSSMSSFEWTPSNASLCASAPASCERMEKSTAEAPVFFGVNDVIVLVVEQTSDNEVRSGCKHDASSWLEKFASQLPIETGLETTPSTLLAQQNALQFTLHTHCVN